MCVYRRSAPITINIVLSCRRKMGGRLSFLSSTVWQSTSFFSFSLNFFFFFFFLKSSSVGVVVPGSLPSATRIQTGRTYMYIYIHTDTAHTRSPIDVCIYLSSSCPLTYQLPGSAAISADQEVVVMSLRLLLIPHSK